jgi:hypothetical protein
MAKAKDIKHTDSEWYWYIRGKDVINILGLDIGIIYEDIQWANWIKN